MRQNIDHSALDITVFQSTHPRGVRPNYLCFSSYLNSFNPRTHEGCDCFFVYVGRCYKSFNPRTHEGCDFSIDAFKAGTTVSIHAPTRGATVCCSTSIGLRRVSIHAPTRGATGTTKIKRTFIQFQSTHPRGVRLVVINLRCVIDCFNPRTHEGCDGSCSFS